MISYVASMCFALPLALLPVWLLSKTNRIDTTQRERMALDMGQWCARSLLFIMPFIDVTVQSDAAAATSTTTTTTTRTSSSSSSSGTSSRGEDPQPSIWVCNHTSMLDTFILLACDQRLRGRNKRPIKTIYWKGLEDNPICNLLFKLAGFIPVEMEANAAGVANNYDKKSFLRLLKDTKRAFDQGFDLLILPEGQLNPWPEQGLLPVFPGAHKLSQMSRRPIRMVALYGCHNLWHADDSIIGMTVMDKTVKARAYAWDGRMFDSGEEFVDTFRAVVGQFGATGVDLPPEELAQWLDGSKWKEEQQQKQKKQTMLLDSPRNVEDVEEEISRALKSETKQQQTNDDLVPVCNTAEKTKGIVRGRSRDDQTSHHP
jgi:1-acyl-sn-glycerol-3-phosphate acyltransferase